MKFAVVILVAVCACGSDPEAPQADGGPIDVSDLRYEPCADESRVGGFTLELHSDFSSSGGSVSDGVTPIGQLETISETGVCRHARGAVPFCDPACGAGDVCGLDETCRPAPVRKSVGKVVIQGLDAPIEMEPLPPRMEYTNPGTLPHPVIAPGQPVRMETAGGDYSSFALRGIGVDPVVLSQTEVPLVSGAALELAWTAPSVASPSMVLIELNINLHGAAGSRIECLVEDTGSFSIPEPMITTLVEDGLSGFPAVRLVRSSAERVEISDGCVDFRVTTETAASVAIPGLDSCSNDDDCTEVGETCQPDLTCG